MLKSAIIATLAVFGAADLTQDRYHDAFTTFIKKYQKSYPIDEVFARFTIFKANMMLIEEHNAKGLSWTMGVNEFTDMSPKEFKDNYTGLKVDNASQPVETVEQAMLVDDIDWTNKGVVTPVKNQGQCGSCWAFSTTGAVEGAVALATGRLTSLSEQELVDCAGSSGNAGCNGGLMNSAFDWIIQQGGLCTEAAYPYKAVGGACQKSCQKVSPIKSHTSVAKSEAALASALTGRPIAIAIEADQSSFQYYKSGVMTGLCGQNLDHGVLLVGSGTDSGLSYWKVKNSWGASWGEAGFIRLVTGKNQCGLTNMASYPTA